MINKFKKLSDIATIAISGIDKKTNKNERPIKLCNFTDVYNNWAITKYHIPDFMDASATDSEIKKFTLRKGQVAITKDSETKDDIGISTYIDDNFDNTILGYHCALITPFQNISDGRFLNMVLNSHYARVWFSFNASGSGQRYTLTQDTLNSIMIPDMPYTEQVKIGELLDDINNKIVINNELKKQILTFINTLYNYWFVQYDFPNINGKPYKTNGGTFYTNEILKKNIPTDWKAIQIKDIVNILSGFPFKSEDYLEKGKYRILTIKNVKDDFIDIDSVNFLDTLPSNLPDYCKLNIGDILISLTGNVGRIGTVYTNNCLLNQRVGKLLPNKQLVAYIYCLFNSTELKIIMNNIAGGTSQSNLSPIETENLYIPYNEDVAKLFNEKISPMLTKIVKLEQEINSLKILESSIFDLIMNGQVKLIK